MLNNKWTATVLVLLACYGAYFIGDRLWGPHGEITINSKPGDKTKGSQNAPLWIVEYFDLQCEACKAAQAQMDQYYQTYPDRVFLQARFEPLKRHPHSVESAIYAECASRQGKFWEFVERAFDQQEKWSGLDNITESFRGYATYVGLDLRRLDACVADPKVKQLIIDQKAQNEKLGINSTPTFFINGKRTVGISETFAELRRLEQEAPDART